VLEIARTYPGAEGEPKEVDHLLSVLTQQVGAQNPARSLLDQRLETCMSQCYPSRGIPVRRVSVVCRIAQASAWAASSVRPTRASGGVVKTTLGMPA